MLKNTIKILKNKKITLLIMLVVIVIYIISNKGIIGRITPQEKEASVIEPFSYVVYDNKDETKIKTLVTINSEKGIEYIKCPNGNIVYVNGKETLSVDYEVKKEEEYFFSIKEIEKEEKRMRLYVDDKVIEDTAIAMNILTESIGYEEIEIDKKIKLSGYDSSSYKIGKNGSWYSGETFNMVDYDLKQRGLINEDNTVTISISLRNNSNNNEVILNKDISIDGSEVNETINANSILEAISQENLQTGKYQITVLDEMYNAKLYNIKGNTEMNLSTSFGIGEDVGGTKDDYAKNMIIVKVNGDLTINSGRTITTYGTEYGGPKGMLIYCTGTLTNNGTISMTKRGAKAEGQNVYLWKKADGSYETVPKIGGSGGASVGGGKGSHSTHGKKGDISGTRGTGGGGSGGATCGAILVGNYSGRGGNGTSYSGGTGGGSAIRVWNGSRTGTITKAGQDGSDIGGKGGDGYTKGAGNPTGGTGGLLIVYANSLVGGGTYTAKGSNRYF